MARETVINMTKLIACKFEGLEGFGTLELSDLRELTSLTGPNGAGKSSILQILKLALEILSIGTLCDEPPPHDPWHRFNRATLCFGCSQLGTTPHLGGHFDNATGNIVVELCLNQNQFEIRTVSCGEISVSFPEPQVTGKTLIKLRSDADAIEAAKKELEDLLAAPTSTNANQTPQAHQQALQNRQQWSARLGTTQQSLDAKMHEIDEQSLACVRLSGDEQTQQLSRVEVDGFLKSLHFPTVEHVDARQLYDEAIPKLIAQLLVQKKGRLKDNNAYLTVVQRLAHLVQAEVDVSEVDGQEGMHLDNVNYRKASAGTQITLAFFGLTRLGESNCIILWDEPENGLHPTRRVRLLELMFDDQRQFILATHASEFAPIFSTRGKVFRCESKYDSDDSVIRLSAQHVADRRDAFRTLEALGVHPARTLFTANVVIWVEGPTELLFYRRWLVPRLELRGFHEGFHFTFMQYGGALISYLTVADNEHFDSTFDLLSMCRHPVIIVDSDLRNSPATRKPSEFLKQGAARILDEVEKLNSERPEAALFKWTSGREVENYLPEFAVWHAVSCVWQGYESHKVELKGSELRIGQYDSYDEALEKHFIAANVVQTDNKDAAKGRSRWGSGNKVEMMRAALTAPKIDEASLKWDCSTLLQSIEEFVVSSSEK